LLTKLTRGCQTLFEFLTMLTKRARGGQTHFRIFENADESELGVAKHIFWYLRMLKRITGCQTNFRIYETLANGN